jgi:hypothetical protein
MIIDGTNLGTYLLIFRQHLRRLWIEGLTKGDLLEEMILNTGDLIPDREMFAMVSETIRDFRGIWKQDIHSSQDQEI